MHLFNLLLREGIKITKTKRTKVDLNEHKYIESLTDEEIVSAILNRDTRITRLYLYEKCYPLFKACYDKYYTDFLKKVDKIVEYHDLYTCW